MLLQSALREKRGRALRGIKSRIGIDAAGPHQVTDDQRGIGDAHAGVLDERQLALGPLAGIERVDDLVGNLRNAQPGLELAAEGAEVREAEQCGETGTA